jgi:hypothetical protein
MFKMVVLMLGGAIGAFGFLAMRDPIRFTLFHRFSPQFTTSYAYYQRLVLDRGQRLQLRVLAAILSLFGFMIATASLGSIVHSKKIDSVSEGLLALMGLLFFGAWCGGLVSVVCPVV